MSAAVMMKRIAEASPRSLARMAGVSQLLEALTATFGQASVITLRPANGDQVKTGQ